MIGRVPQSQTACALKFEALSSFDGHGNHGTIQFITYVYEYNIVLIYLPPHVIHRLQPLDVTIFDLLTKYYFDIVKDRSRYEERDVSKQE